MSVSLAKLYQQQQLAGGSLSKDDFLHSKLLCEEILQFLTMIDPGTTKVMLTFLLQHNKAKLMLDKVNFEDGHLSREDYLQSIKEAVIIENKAQKVFQNSH